MQDKLLACKKKITAILHKDNAFINTIITIIIRVIDYGTKRWIGS